MGCICSISRQIFADVNIRKESEIKNSTNNNKIFFQNQRPKENIIIEKKNQETSDMNQVKLRQPKKEEKEKKDNTEVKIIEKKEENKDELKEKEEKEKKDINEKKIIEKKVEKNNEDKEKKQEEENLTKNHYNQRVFELINQIRINPSEYSQTILDNISNIIIENHKVINKETGEEENKQEIVFKKKVKVNLYKGEESFREAVNVLNKTPPMDKLIFNKDIVIPLPDNEQDIIHSTFIKNKANEIRQHSNINIYFKEYIKNPEIAVLLMIVDDTEIMSGKKRECLLNPNIKYIGIDSKFIGKSFNGHFSFSK